MRVSLRWIKDYVEISVTLEQLCDRLTMAGLEVKGIEIIGRNWQNVVVGKIIGVNAHPNADRLRLVSVDLGERQYTVVCGAPNLVVGDKIAFACVGARLIDGYSGKVVQLKPAKIRGIVSEGMICSEKELGISDNHEEIMVLPQEAPVGIPLAEYLGDTIIDLEITPNRPDCLSVIGVAREIAALTGKKVHIPEVCYRESEKSIDSFVSVEIVEPELCPRYCASLIEGIKVAPSPHWLQRRLIDYGMRPINNIVDITNYVMLEYGQPLHAFDYSQIYGRQIIVRRAREGEVITTLDGVERSLSADMLVIADKERAIAIAGIMGGANTEVTADTTAVLIESANFAQAVIRRSSIALRLRSEASLRFEKGLSRELPLVALKRATQLIAELAGGEVAKGIADVYPGKVQSKSILLSAPDIRRLLGVDLSIDEIVKTLESLGFDCEKPGSSSKISVQVPWWRTDVNCIADLAEEVARVIGYDKIPATMLSAPLPFHQPMPILSLRRQLRSILVSCGFQEVLTYSLTSLEMLSKLSPEFRLKGLTPIKIANPMSKEQEYLRTTLRCGLLSVLARNERYQEGNIKLFEIGRVFLPQERDLPQEKEMLCAVLGGLQRRLFWRGKEESIDFFVAKGVGETILSRLGLQAKFEPAEDESLCPGRSAQVILDSEVVGFIGEFHPKVVEAFGLSEAAYLIELDLDKLLLFATGVRKYEPIPRYPSTFRDISLVVDERITYQQIYNTIINFPSVKSVTLFDLYTGAQVPPGKKSLAFRIVYQSATRTLTDEEVDGIQHRIIDKLQRDLKATLRG